MSGTPMTTIGQYINIWDTEGNYDVFITLNEANDSVTSCEVDEIERLVRPMIRNKIPVKEIESKVNALKLKCLEYGCQVTERK